MMSALGITVLAFLAIWIVASYLRPPLAFVLIVVLYPLKQVEQTYLPFFVANSSYFNFIVGFSVLAAAYGAISKNRRWLLGFKSGFAGVLLLLYVFAVIAILWSPSQSEAVGHFTAGLPYWAMQILLIPLIFSDIRDFRAPLVPSLVVASIVAILFLTNPQGTYLNARYVLLFGTGLEKDFGNPLASAQMGGQMAFIAALIRPRRENLPWLLGRLAALMLGLWLAVQAGSRGQLLASVFLIVTLYPVARKVKNLSQFFLTAAGLGAIIGIVYLTISFALSASHSEDSRWSLSLASSHLATRTVEAERLLTWWWSEPLSWFFGLGANAYSSLPGAGTYVHNVLVEMLCEYGIFGLTLFLTLLFLTARHARGLFRRHAQDAELRSVVAILIAISLYSFFLSLKQGAFLDVPEPYYFWFLIVKINCSERIAEASYQAQLAEHDAYYAGGGLPGYEDVAAAYGNPGHA